MRANLTDVFVQSVKAPERGQAEYWDRKERGLGLRVSQGGRRTWTLLYRLPTDGRLRRFTLGTYPVLSLKDAREQARDKLADVQKGADPVLEKQERRAADDFARLCERYMAEHALKKKRPKPAREDQRIINKELLPRWGSRKAGDIRRMDVIELTDAIEARGKGTMANRTLALVSTVFAFGVDKGVVEANPAYRVKKPGEERTRDRVLNEGEIRALWTALESEPLKWRAIFRLALLTAQRRSEITGMRWDEVDLDGGWWTIPAERAKNGLAHRVPLVGEAARIVRELARKPHDPVFVFRGGRVDRPIANLQKPARRLKVKSGDELRKAIPSALPDGQPVDFRFHDLRRTAASLMTGSKIPRLVVSKILNHVERGITAVYDRHAYDSEKRGALTRWDVRLRQILTGKAAAKVVELRA